MIWVTAILAALWFAAGFLVGQQQQKILKAIEKLNREPEEQPAVTTALPPEQAVYRGPAIVTPKTPYEVEVAEEREIERKIREAGNG